MQLLWAVWIGMMAMLAFAGTAAHANTAYAPGQGAVNSLALGIDVKASVKDRCGFASAPNASISQADFDTAGFTRDIPLVLNCTGASRVAVSSANGGLRTDVTATGFASKAPYDVTVNLVADNATKANATCAASTLSAGGTCAAFAGAASSSTGLRLGATATKSNGSYLRISAAPYGAGAAPLVAGTYSDTLTVTVSAAL